MSTDDAEYPLCEDEYLAQIQDEYREKTGHELPDHVLENYQTFFLLGPSVNEVNRAFKAGRKAEQSWKGNNRESRKEPLINITINWPFGGDDDDG